MLNRERLKLEIKTGFDQIFPEAFAQGYESIMGNKTAEGTKVAKAFGDTMCELLSEPMAEVLSSAIDYYVRNGWIKGNLFAIGSPYIHRINIRGVAQPINGVLPNTLKIY